MSKKYWERPITLRLTPYQRKVLSQVVDGALDAGACKDGLSKLESNALSSVFERLIGVRENLPPAAPPCPACGALGHWYWCIRDKISGNDALSTTGEPK